LYQERLALSSIWINVEDVGHVNSGVLTLHVCYPRKVLFLIIGIVRVVGYVQRSAHLGLLK